MGQQIGREHGAVPRRRSNARASLDSRCSIDGRQNNASEPEISADTRVAGGYVVPQGVYKKDPGGDTGMIRKLILERKLAPFYPAVDDDTSFESAEASECPICFMNFPTALNYSRCCRQPICTECFVQIKRAPPNVSADPPSHPATCPFCVTENFGVIFAAPENGAQDSTDAVLARTEAVFGTGGAGVNRNGISPSSSCVVLVDQVHPEWRQQLAEEQEQVARRSTRRVIMRQVGDTVVPVCVSSSRTGRSLADAVGQNAALGRSVQGGNIVLTANTQPGRQQPRRDTLFRRSLNLARRNTQPDSPRQGTLRVNAAEVEELMIAEAMRRSVIDHEREVEMRKASISSEPAPNSGVQSSATTAAAPAITTTPTAIPTNPFDSDTLHSSTTTIPQNPYSGNAPVARESTTTRNPFYTQRE